MKRSERILSMLNCQPNSYTDGPRKKKQKKQEKKGVPDYVQMFDRGQWELLDRQLRTPIEICNKNVEVEKIQGIDNEICKMKETEENKGGTDNEICNKNVEVEKIQGIDNEICKIRETEINKGGRDNEICNINKYDEEIQGIYYKVGNINDEEVEGIHYEICNRNLEVGKIQGTDNEICKIKKTQKNIQGSDSEICNINEEEEDTQKIDSVICNMNKDDEEIQGIYYEVGNKNDEEVQGIHYEMCNKNVEVGKIQGIDNKICKIKKTEKNIRGRDSEICDINKDDEEMQGIYYKVVNINDEEVQGIHYEMCNKNLEVGKIQGTDKEISKIKETQKNIQGSDSEICNINEGEGDTRKIDSVICNMNKDDEEIQGIYYEVGNKNDEEVQGIHYEMCNRNVEVEKVQGIDNEICKIKEIEKNIQGSDSEICYINEEKGGIQTIDSVICNINKDEKEIQGIYYEVGNRNEKEKVRGIDNEICKIKEREDKIQVSDSEICSINDEEIQGIEIASVAKYPTGKRYRTKQHCCKFCHKLMIGIGRHILTVHKEELEVAQLLSLNKDKRKTFLEQIEREGDYIHNKEVLATGKGELILVRRPTENEIVSHTYEDYGPCTGCLGFMLKAHLWHHVKYGCKATSTDKCTPFSVRLGSEALLSAGLRVTYSPDFEKHCIGKLSKDIIGKTCTNEASILRFGDYLFQKNLTVDPNQRAHNVRSNMRVLATLYVTLKERIPSLTNFTEVFDPTHFNTIVSTVKSICDYDEISKKSDLVSPSKAIRLGIELIKMGEFLHGEHIMKGDSIKEKAIKKFIFLVKTQWNTRISCTARSTLEQRKYNTAEVLPLTSDLLKLNKHIQDVCLSKKIELEKEISPTAYRKLSEALLTRIVLFNKRRSGETSKIKIKQFVERGTWAKETTEELKATLSKTEQDLAENLTLVYVKGKRRSKVPVLLTADMKELLELLLRVRNVHGIENNNPYVFARPYPAETPLRGHDCLRKMCEGAGLTEIDRVTGTKLRKYVATVSQVFNLTENETDWLAKHMGHDVRVHRQFYRLHESALELTKVSRILLAIDKGKANRFAGKKLNEINIEDLSDLEEDGQEPVQPDQDEDLSEGDEDLRLNQNHPDEGLQNKDRRFSITPTTNTVYEEDDSDYIPEEELNQNSRKKTKKNGRSVKKTPWTTEEKTAVLQFFRDTITQKKGVKKEQADQCLQQHSILKGRTWLNIRDFIRNHIRKL